jgi:hypothetical protein
VVRHVVGTRPAGLSLGRVVFSRKAPPVGDVSPVDERDLFARAVGISEDTGTDQRARVSTTLGRVQELDPIGPGLWTEIPLTERGRSRRILPGT